MAAIDEILAGHETLRPTLRTGTEALLAAALAWLAP
jgi:hypothetical protein